MHLLTLVAAALIWPAVAFADLEHITVASGIQLQPGGTRVVAIKSAEPLEIGWENTQAKPCTMSCVEASIEKGGAKYSWAAPMGGSKEYTPDAGKITITFRNVSKDPVAINVFKVKRTCKAASCAFVKNKKSTRPMVIKVGLFKAVTKGKDGSYSVVTGVTEAGKPFVARVLWWTDNPKNALINCHATMQAYVDKQTPREEYSPFILPGRFVGDDKTLAIDEITGCVPKGAKYGMDESSLYK